MKLTSVELHPDSSAAVAAFSFRDPSHVNPYSIRSILGLDAAELTPVFYESNGVNQFYRHQQPPRDIVILVDLYPNFALNKSFADLRDDLYKMIASYRTGKVTLQFLNGATIVATLSGFVTKFESAQFAREQQVQLTVHVPDPVLRAPNPVIVPVAGLNPASTTLTDTQSTAPHGFAFSVSFATAQASWKMTDPTDASWSFEVTPNGGFLPGDVLYVSSILNNKYVYIMRSGSQIQLANRITPKSSWPIMFPGSKTFAMSPTPANMAWQTISYYPTYWGV